MSIEARLKSAIVKIKDYPKTGVTFQDLSYIYSKPVFFKESVSLVKKLLHKHTTSDKIKIVSPEARGFILGSSVAHTENLGFLMARKLGKTPQDGETVAFDTEYSSGFLEINKHLIADGEDFVIIDDVLATGGTMKAISQLIEKCGGRVILGIAFLGITELKSKWSTLPFTTDVVLES